MKQTKKNWFFLSVMMTAAVVMLSTGVQLYAGTEAGGTFAKGFMPTLERAKAYSLEMAGLMPEKDYSFKPTPDIMSFAEQTAHTAGVMYFFASKVKGEENPGKGFKAEGKSKADIVKFLTDAFQYSEKVLAGLNDKDAHQKIPVFGELVLTKAQIYQLLQDHTTHHRGQMVIYLRLKGIKPAQYKGW
ncbi:MAG: DinB family protein [bacterium]|nr:DinB family protein [bacterium]